MSPRSRKPAAALPSQDLSKVSFESLVAEMIRRCGDDPEREGMAKTPERVRKAWEFLTQGYRMTPADAIGGALFEEHHHNMVLVKDIELYSMCEHHLLPFFGKAHVAYIPDGKIMGLSKAARLVDVFARRFQVQERLTEQIAQAIWDTIQPQGVGVVIEAYHLCMMMRGVEKQNSKTITSAVRGAFMEEASTRDEFLRLAVSPHHPLY
jgi:GTP cyclohydrolase I